jgi:23S rRNA-/tRNA-specific pseudouridylate synthase
MHQIRVHMESMGNPILWDKTYGDKKINSYLQRKFWLTRQALHAWKIEFFHYGRNKKVKLEARIKKDLIDFVRRVDLP